MAHFYGDVKGHRGEAHRTGTKNSGIETHTACWNGAIRVAIWHNDKTGKDEYIIEKTPWMNSGEYKLIERGEM